MCGSTTRMTVGTNLKLKPGLTRGMTLRVSNPRERFLHLTTVEFQMLSEQMIVIKKEEGRKGNTKGRVPRNTNSMIFMPEGASQTGELEDDDEEEEEEDKTIKIST